MEFKHIDELLKSTLEGYSQEPSPGVWRNISFRLFSLQAGIYLSVIILLIISGFIYFFMPANKDIEISQINNSNPEVAIISYQSSEPFLNNESGSDTNEELIINKKVVENKRKLESNPNQLTSSKIATETTKNTYDSEHYEYLLASNQNHFSQYPDLIRFHELASMNQKEVFSLSDFPKSLSFNIRPIETRNFYGKNTTKNNVDYAKTAAFGLGFTITPEVIINENYKNNNTLNFDITANYFKNDWFIQAGLGIGITQDDGIFDVQYAQYDSIGYYNKVNSFSVDPTTGKLIYKTEIEGVFDTVEYSQESVTKNYYSYLRIPFHAGINLRNFKRWSIDLKGGAIYSLLLNKAESDFTYDNSQATWVKINNETPARIKSNVQLSAAVAFNYQINQNLYFHVEPVYSYYLQSVYEKRYDIKSPFSLGLRMGLLLKL